MQAIRQLLVRLAGEESGGEALECAIVIGLVSLTALAAVRTFGARLYKSWKAIDDALGMGL